MVSQLLESAAPVSDPSNVPAETVQEKTFEDAIDDHDQDKNIKIEIELDNADYVEAEAEAIFQDLVNTAIHLPDHGIPHAELEASYSELDVARLARGRAFCRRHMLSCLTGFGLATMAQMSIQRYASWVYRNSNRESQKTLLVRLLTALHGVVRWLEDGIEDKDSQTARNVLKIRKVHSAVIRKHLGSPPPKPVMPKRSKLEVLQALRADLAHAPSPNKPGGEYLVGIMTDNPTVPISQFDMAISQAMLFSYLDVNPNAVGFHPKGEVDEDYEAHVYYVGVVGRYLGIHDRYNFGLIANPAVRKAVSKRIWERIYFPCAAGYVEGDFQTITFYTECLPVIKYVNPVALGMYALAKAMPPPPKAESSDGVDSSKNSSAILSTLGPIGRSVVKGIGNPFELLKYRPVNWLMNRTALLTLNVMLRVLKSCGLFR